MSFNLDQRLNWVLKSNAAVHVNFDQASREDYPLLLDAIKQLIAEVIQELVGSDEDVKILSRVADGAGVYEVDIRAEARNELRAEFKQRAKELGL